MGVLLGCLQNYETRIKVAEYLRFFFNNNKKTKEFLPQMLFILLVYKWADDHL